MNSSQPALQSSASGSVQSANGAANDLIHATSPYLLSHAKDPIHWQQWSIDVLNRAKQQDKLIFLSVGYSACHWCHVMQHESFSDQAPQISEKLNQDFISIKVDREERPDVDSAYMGVVQALSGRGGWPMSVFLTPDGEPLFGGTYFPPRQFESLLDRLHDLWTDKRQDCLTSAQGIAQKLRMSATGHGTGAAAELPELNLVLKTIDHWLREYDPVHHGFGSAPKFPSPSLTHYFIHRFVAAAFSTKPSEELVQAAGGLELLRGRATEALKQSVKTLIAIGRGGIHDPLGGGIARYSVDDEFRVPHFEKMLYDQGQLLQSYCEAIQLAGSPSAPQELRDLIPELQNVSRGIIDYLARDLTHPEGGLFAAEDADSYPSHDAEKKLEGAFYVWEQKEIGDVLGAETETYKLVKAHYGIKADGNIPGESDPHGELTGKNMLHSTTSVIESGARLGFDAGKSQALFDEATSKLFSYREQRPRPHLDDKVIATSNFLAISGLARAAEVLPSSQGGEKARDMALRCQRFIFDKMWDGQRRVLTRSWRNDVKGPEAFDVDYATGAQAMLDLFELTGDRDMLEKAVELQRVLDERYWDGEGPGGYLISTAEGDGNILGRQRSDQDGAEPSATSVAANNLLRFSALFSDVDAVLPHPPNDKSSVKERIQQSVGASDLLLKRAPQAIGTRIAALLRQGVVILIVGPKESQTTRSFVDAARRRFIPDRSLIVLDTSGGADEARKRYATLCERNGAVRAALEDPRLQQSDAGAGGTAAHICRDFACGLPTKDVEAFERELEDL